MRCITVARVPAGASRLYQPDTLATYKHRGKTYVVMANEGDFREDDGDRSAASGLGAINYLSDGDQIIRRALTVRATEKLAQTFLNDTHQESSDVKKAPAAREIDIHVRAITNRLREHLATHVAIQHSAKKGKIEIEYYGDDDLQRLLELIGLGASE